MSLKSDKDTICYKVDKSIDLAKESMKTQTLDIYSLIQNLDNIRKDAMRMERAIKLRKEVMLKHNLEDEYQTLKGKRNEQTGINTVPVGTEFTKDIPEFEVIIKDKDGKIIYQNQTLSGVCSFVEKIEDIDEQGMIDGQTQQFAFGHDLAIWYAFDQLRQGIETQMVRIALALRNSIQNKSFSDPQKKKAILDRINKR